MRAIRTPSTTGTFELVGGGPERGLPFRHGPSAGAARIVEAGDPCYHMPFVATVWEPTHEERAHLAIGRNVELVLLTAGPVPPLSVAVTDELPVDAEAANAIPLDHPAIWAAMELDLCEDLVTVVELLDRQAGQARDRGDELDAQTSAALDRLVPFADRLKVYAAELRAEAEGTPDA